MRLIASLAAVLVLVACAGKESTDRTFTAAHVSDAIKAHPAAADSILKANGYTRESFEREMYDIAADSARSAAYVAAKRG
jgi:hypothetical protein